MIEPIPIKHGNSDIYGYKIGGIAYLTDVSVIPEQSIALLKGVKILLLDCLRYKTHYSHINLEQNLSYASLIGADATYLIHMTHDLEFSALSAQLPDSVFVGYDGLKIDIN